MAAKSVKGLVCLVTGGGSGLGRATAERLVGRGARVVVADLPDSPGEQVARSLGEDCKYSPTDVTVTDDITKAIDLTQRSFGRLDAVVNSAGIAQLGLTYNFRENKPLPLDIFKRILAVNTTGTFNVIRLAVGLMSKNEPVDDDGQRGVIVNVASISAFDAARGYTAYAASKWALVGMTLPLARDLAAIGIRVCTLAPGIFDTPIWGRHGSPINVDEQFAKSVPFPKRGGKPEEFAHMVETVISNPMVNGEVIRIDGASRAEFM